MKNRTPYEKATTVAQTIEERSPEEGSVENRSEAKVEKNKRFEEVLKKHLKEASWNQQDLAKASRVSESQISGMIKGDRSVSKAIIDDISVALIMRYRERAHPKHKEKKTVSAIQQEFLVATGLTHNLGYELNDTWNKLLDRFVNQGRLHISEEKPTLRVGWNRWASFAGDSEFRGASREITEEIERMMGVRFDYVMIQDPRERAQLIATRQIDLIAPTMMIPVRMFHHECSMHLADVHGGLNFIVPSKYHKDIGLRDGMPCAPLNSWEINVPKIRIHYPEGKSPEYLLPRLSQPPIRCERHDDYQSALDRIYETPIDEHGIVQIVCADQFTCHHYVRNSQGRLTLAYPKPDIPLPLVLATSHHEPRLLTLLNEAIRLLNHAGIPKLIFSRHKDELGSEETWSYPHS